MQAQSIEEPVGFKEKFFVSFGMGVDHAFAGFKLEYQLKEQWTIYSCFGMSQLLHFHPPTLGTRYTFKRALIKRFTPFSFFQIGRDHFLNLNKNTKQLPIGSHKSFGAANVGLCLQYSLKFKPAVAINFGVSYKFIHRKKVNQYIADFNETYRTNYNSNYTALLPILALRINFAQLYRSKVSSK